MEPGLKIEHWYHVLVFVGIAGTIASLTLELKGIANAHALMLFLGLMLVGLGEWINHPLQEIVIPPNAYTGYAKLTGHPRSPKPLGITFDLIGLALVGIAAYKMAVYA